MRCFVTGANGFMGARLAAELVAAGYEVRAGVGEDQGLENLEGLPVEIQPMDLLRADSLAAAVAGCDVVFHTAAIYSFWTRDPEHIYRVNVEGTRALLEAAHAARVRRVVHTSSTATLTPALAPARGNEDDVFDGRRFQGHYKVSKVMAENVALRAAAAGLPVNVVYPTTVLGHGDRRPTPTGTMIVHFLKGRMRAYTDTVLNVVDVEDVARGQRLVLEKGHPGQRYLLGGENLSMQEIVAVLSDLTGLPPARIRLSPRLLEVLGAIGEWWADHVSGKPPLVDRESALHARSNRPFDNRRAREELGFDPAPARRTLARALDWFLGQGVASPEVVRQVSERGALARALSDGV